MPEPENLLFGADAQRRPALTPRPSRDEQEHATYCQSIVGQQVTAYALGLCQSKLIGQVSRGRHQLSPEQAHRLATLTDGVRRLAEVWTARAVNTCLFGMCPALDDESTLEQLRHGNAERFTIGVEYYRRSYYN